MEIKTLSKKVVTSALALTLAFSVFAPTLKVNAANYSTATTVERREINGNGVRLRQEGHDGGAVLELMYDGEPINYFPDILGSDPEYNYMHRLQTGTYGYVHHDFVK